MTYEVIIHPQVANNIKKLPRSQQEKIARLFDILESIAIPFREFDVKKLKGQIHRYRIRLGKFRLIYEVIKEKKTILILKLEARKKAYT
jgi:mRNA interferase RelE/StbE